MLFFSFLNQWALPSLHPTLSCNKKKKFRNCSELELETKYPGLALKVYGKPLNRCPTLATILPWPSIVSSRNRLETLGDETCFRPQTTHHPRLRLRLVCTREKTVLFLDSAIPDELAARCGGGDFHLYGAAVPSAPLKKKTTYFIRLRVGLVSTEE